ncbi:hypothetical protein JCM11641_004808 [Rhodosporidiobolus odoratus]
MVKPTTALRQPFRTASARVAFTTSRSATSPFTARSAITFPSTSLCTPSASLSPLSTSSATYPRPHAPFVATRRGYAAARRNPAIDDAPVCVAQPPPNPPEDFEPVEEELQEGEKLEMRLTEAAIKQILRAQTAASNPTLALRLAVESGGCHGYQYKMLVTSAREADDYLFESPSTQEGDTARLLVDAASLPLVKGSTVDYATELIGSSFRIVGNPQSKDAGCWELKDLD